MITIQIGGTFDKPQFCLEAGGSGVDGTQLHRHEAFAAVLARHFHGARHLDGGGDCGHCGGQGAQVFGDGSPVGRGFGGRPLWP